MKKLLTLVLCLALCLSLCACNNEKPHGRVMFTFDGEEVKEEEFIFSFRNIITYFEGQFETGFSEMIDIDLGDGKTIVDICEAYAVQEVGYAAAVRKLVKDNKIAWTAEHEELYANMMDYYAALEGSLDALKENLVLQGLTIEMLENSVRQYVYLGAAADWAYETGVLSEPDEAELYQIFEESHAKIKTVFISFEDLSEKEIEAKYIKIGQLRTRLEQGESIDTIIAEVGEESGEYVIDDSASYDADLVTAVFAAEKGAVAEVKIGAGYHIFVRENLSDEDFEEKRDTLLAATKDERFSKYIDTLYSSAKMTVDEKLYNRTVDSILGEY